jgi:hypothetical protein
MTQSLANIPMDELITEITRRGFSCRVQKKRAESELTPHEKEIYNVLTNKWQTKNQIQKLHPEIKNGGFYSYLGLLIKKNIVEKRYHGEAHYGQMWRQIPRK